MSHSLSLRSALSATREETLKHRRQARNSPIGIELPGRSRGRRTAKANRGSANKGKTEYGAGLFQ